MSRIHFQRCGQLRQQNPVWNRGREEAPSPPDADTCRPAKGVATGSEEEDERELKVEAAFGAFVV